MNCPEIGDLLSEYLDGALDTRTAASIETHLAACQSCRKHLAELRAVVEELRALPRRTAPPRITADVSAEVRRRVERSRKRSALPSFAGGLALAAAALLIAFGVSYFLRTPQRSLPSAPNGLARPVEGGLALRRSAESVVEIPEAPQPLSMAKAASEGEETREAPLVATSIAADARKGVDALGTVAAAPKALGAPSAGARAEAPVGAALAAPENPEDRLADKLVALGCAELAVVLRSKERADFRYRAVGRETSVALEEAPRDKDEERSFAPASRPAVGVLSDYTHIAFLTQAPEPGKAGLPAVTLAVSSEDPASLRERLAPLGMLYLYERTPGGFAPLATRPTEEEKFDRSAAAPNILIVTIRNP